MDPEKGGTTAAVIGLSQAAQLSHQESLLVTLDAPESPWLRNLGIPVIATGPTRTHYGLTPHLKPVLRKQTPLADLVIAHGLWQYHNRAVWQTCRELKHPYVVFPHGMLDPWALQQSKLKKWLKKTIWHFDTRRFLKDAAAICFTCAEEKSAALPALKDIVSPLRIIPLGIDEPPHEPSILQKSFAQQHPDLTGRRIVLFLGRLHPKKGCDLLLESYASWLREAPGDLSRIVHLRLAGPAATPEYLISLKKRAKQLGLTEGSCISFPGMISARNKWQELAAAEVMILPSHQENFAIVVGEALAVGTPVLLSTKVNTWRWITASNAGLACEPSIQGILHLLREWFGLDSSRRRQMADATLPLFRSQFSSARAIEHFLTVVREFAQ